MAKLGVVDENQWKEELANCSQSISKSDNKITEGVVVDDVPRGRGIGNVEVPEELRKIIGEESVINGRQAALNLAKDFDISPSSVSAYAKGATSTATYHKPDQTLQNYLESRKKRITKKSLRVLHTALDILTPDKLNGIKARDISAIAKDMSVISKNMSPENNVEQNTKPQFVIYAPTMRDERSYETIVVKDDF